MGKLTGKVALVTGMAKGGTGFAIASRFLQEGASVMVMEIDQAKLDAALAELGPLGSVAGRVGDVSAREDAKACVDETVERFGKLDVLVNNAALNTHDTMLVDMDDELIARNLGPSLYGTIYMMQAAYPQMRANGGSIINFGSRAGLIGMIGLSIYAAAKEGIRGLSRSMAREWGKDKIRVNVVCPAVVSPFAQEFWDKNPDLSEHYLQGIALGYRGEAYQDIAPVVVFLASDDSHYVTGQTINVDGGQAML